jgi:hypothetical protein
VRKVFGGNVGGLVVAAVDTLGYVNIRSYKWRVKWKYTQLVKYATVL